MQRNDEKNAGRLDAQLAMLGAVGVGVLVLILQTSLLKKKVDASADRTAYYKKAELLSNYYYSKGVAVSSKHVREAIENVAELRPKYFPEGPFTDDDLLAIAMVESDFNPMLVGLAGEQGMFQIMPDAFTHYGVRRNHFDVATNADMALKILAYKFKTHKEYKKAIIAYNGVVVGADGRWSEKYWKRFKKAKEDLGVVWRADASIRSYETKKP